MQQIRIVNTDVRHIDLESLELMAKDPTIEAEIRGDGDVYISETTEVQ